MEERKVESVKCPTCEGTGEWKGEECPECGGEKIVNRVYCWTCGKASRTIDLEKCDFCDDTGHVAGID
ncbi:MAG: hypothetical protein R6W92_09160 [Desulfocurvibacter africanus]